MFKLVITSIKIIFFIVKLFFKVWIENLVIGGYIIVFMIVSAIKNVNFNLIYIGFSFGLNLGKFDFFGVLFIVFLFLRLLCLCQI